MNVRTSRHDLFVRSLTPHETAAHQRVASVPSHTSLLGSLELALNCRPHNSVRARTRYKNIPVGIYRVVAKI